MSKKLATAGSYWKEKSSGRIVKIIVEKVKDYGLKNFRYSGSAVIVFKFHSKKSNFIWCLYVKDFYLEFEPAVWQEGKWI